MKYDPHVIKEFIDGLDIPYRGCCPCCGNTSFSVFFVDTAEIGYKCYHANCGVKGKYNGQTLTLDKVKDISYKIYPELKIPEKFDVKKYNWGNPLQNGECLSYMERYHILTPYIERRCDVRYDPAQRRCVFLLKWKDTTYGATGRALSKGVRPKWYVYSRLEGCPFIIESQSAKNRDVLVIVEDCASACRVSTVASGLSLLGTNYSSSLRYLWGYRSVFVALDDDATKKSLSIQQYLDLTTETKIIPLRKDLKYFSDQELKEWATEYLV